MYQCARELLGDTDVYTYYRHLDIELVPINVDRYRDRDRYTLDPTCTCMYAACTTRTQCVYTTCACIHTTIHLYTTCAYMPLLTYLVYMYTTIAHFNSSVHNMCIHMCTPLCIQI